MLKWIDKVHLVAGYRTIDAKRFRRNWAERLFHWMIRIIFALRLKDPECWFLLARRSIFTRIPIQSSGPFAFAELLASPPPARAMTLVRRSAYSWYSTL